MQLFVGEMCYEHQNYLDDLERKERYKKELKADIEARKFSIFKEKKIRKLVQDLCDMYYFLDEDSQKKLILNEEIWISDVLVYNVNSVYDFIVQNSIEMKLVDTKEIIQYCSVDNDMDIKYVKMNDTLRKSKEKNPIIILVSDMFIHPFVINGNHRIRNAYKLGISEIEVYVVEANDVVESLITEDYKRAYFIYQQLHRLMGMMLNC